MEGVSTVEDMERETPSIYATLEEWQEDHQYTMIKVECKIAHQSISIIIDPKYTHSYVTPLIMETCYLVMCKRYKSWII